MVEVEMHKYELETNQVYLEMTEAWKLSWDRLGKVGNYIKEFWMPLDDEIGRKNNTVEVKM